MEQVFIGIDVSKDRLDVAFWPAPAGNNASTKLGSPVRFTAIAISLGS